MNTIKIYLGIDVGSVSTNVIAMDKDDNVIIHDVYTNARKSIEVSAARIDAR